MTIEIAHSAEIEPNIEEDIASPSLTIILPAYNEEKLIAASLDSLIKAFVSEECYMCSVTPEIIVVDDGSTDRTVQIVSSYQERCPQLALLQNGRNRGKGYSIRRAMLQARGQRIVFIDADLPYSIDSLLRVCQALIGEAALVIGSRLSPEAQPDKKTSSEAQTPLSRSLAGRIFNLLVRLLLFPGIPDTQCGLKGFQRQAATDIFSRAAIDGFGFDVEALFLARRLGYAIQSVPVQLVHYRPDSRVRLGRDSLRMVAELLTIRINDWRGKYTEG